MSEKIKTKKEDFELFKREFLRWVDILGLRGWEVMFLHEQLSDGNIAAATYNMMNRCATIKYSKSYSKQYYSKYEIKKTAFHECCELFFARISSLALYRHTTEDEVTEEIHNIIRTLENTYFSDNQ